MQAPVLDVDHKVESWRLEINSKTHARRGCNMIGSSQIGGNKYDPPHIFLYFKKYFSVLKPQKYCSEKEYFKVILNSDVALLCLKTTTLH